MALSGLIRALGDARCISRGKMVHAQLITAGILPDVYASNHVISFYSKCDLMDDARRSFDQMPERNVVSWTILISGYSKRCDSEESTSCFRSMVADGFVPNDFTHVSVLSACASIGAARAGKEIHGRILRVEHGGLSCFVSNSLVNLYAKCGMAGVARRVFDGILLPSLVSWGSILSCYCQHGHNEEALRIFSRAREVGVAVNEFMLASVLSACAGLGDPTVGKQVHCNVVKNGNGSDRFVRSGIIDMYMKCGELELARRAFEELDEPGLASWAALIGGYTQHCQGEKAMDLFQKLLSSGLRPNEHVFPSALVACSITSSVEGGKQLHSLVIKFGFKMSRYIGNAVVDFYAKCGMLRDSSKVFEEMEGRDIVSWNAMIVGHIEHGDPRGATKLLKLMLSEGIIPNVYTYSIILSLFADLPAIGWGQQTHSRTIKLRFDTNVVVGSALIDMYAKSGRLNVARKVFDRLASKNLVSWNGMLVGYAQHGFGIKALEIFTMMQRESIKPNDITFIGILSACGHVGLVEQGKHYFDLMKEYGIIPRIDHYACMVDMFARSGQIQGAYEFIKGMPLEPNKVIWRSLLAGCKTHGDLSMGRNAAEHILEIDSEEVSASLMMSSVYANADMWDEIAGVREAAKGFKKVPGCSWIELKNRTQYFTAGDPVQAHGVRIHELLNELVVQMVDAGYTPKAATLYHG